MLLVEDAEGSLQLRVTPPLVKAAIPIIFLVRSLVLVMAAAAAEEPLLAQAAAVLA
ncbi:hypothetical protein GCM10027276_32900 [Comamonas piscis]